LPVSSQRHDIEKSCFQEIAEQAPWRDASSTGGPFAGRRTYKETRKRRQPAPFSDIAQHRAIGRRRNAEMAQDRLDRAKMPRQEFQPTRAGCRLRRK
jgi:hypothetical protein